MIQLTHLSGGPCACLGAFHRPSSLYFTSALGYQCYVFFIEDDVKLREVKSLVLGHTAGFEPISD